MASRVQTAVTMRQVTGSMMGVVKGMDGAMKAMDLEKVRRVHFHAISTILVTRSMVTPKTDISGNG